MKEKNTDELLLEYEELLLDVEGRLDSLFEYLARHSSDAREELFKLDRDVRSSLDGLWGTYGDRGNSGVKLSELIEQQERKEIYEDVQDRVYRILDHVREIRDRFNRNGE